MRCNSGRSVPMNLLFLPAPDDSNMTGQLWTPFLWLCWAT